MQLKRMLQILDVLSRPGGLGAMTTARPKSIASFRIVSRLQSTVGEIATIIDAGANIGQFARAISRAYPTASIISFEPLPDVAETLRNNLSDVAGHEVIETALGNEDGSVTFRRASNGGQSSSVLPFTPNQNGLAQGVREVEKLDVKLSKLDTVFQDRDLEGPICLKMDLQGYELEALKGATELLSRCHYVIVETVLEKSYEGEPHFIELVEFLNEHGMTCSGILNTEENERRQIAQIDALFSRV